MNTTFKQVIASKSRSKLYLILAFTSLILLFYSIIQIRPVIVEPTDLLGLASHLTPAYWVGLALILFCSVLAFLDKEPRSDALFLFLLFALGLFLFGIAIFSQEYPRDVGAYYPSAQGKNVLESRYVAMSGPYHLERYSDWPAIHFITASLLAVANIDLLSFIRYFPLFWVLCFIIITYSLGRRLRLPANFSFVLSFFVLSSYWMMWSGYSPQAIAMLLYLLCFMFLLAPRHTPAGSLLAILTFSALVLTHSYAALVVLLATIIISLYLKQTRLVILFFILFLTWYIYGALGALEMGVTQWWSAPLRQIFQLLQQTGSVAGVAPPQRLVLRYAQLSYSVLYLGGGIAAVILLLRGKVNKENGKLIMLGIFWLTGILGLAVLMPAAEALVTDMLGRFYLYGLVPAVCITILAIHNRRLLITLMVLFVALNIPAHYGGEAAWGQVLATEFYGTRFLALQVKPQQPYFYNDGDVQKLIYFHNPDLVTAPILTRQWDFPEPNKIDFSVMNKAFYVVIGKQGRDRVLWSYGEDPMDEWRQSWVGEQASLIYNNGGFQIYVNRQVKPPG